jgi:acid phosphatase (class A)
MSSTSLTRLLRPIAFAIIFTASTVISFGKDATVHYLAPGQPDATVLLAPPPLPGSAEQAADLDEVRLVYHAASSNDIAAAYSEKKFSVFNFTPAVGAFLQPGNLPRTTAFFEKVQADAAAVTDAGKAFFKRPRPYTVDTNLANGKLETSFSYPSGHSTESMVLALVLADLCPEKRDSILAIARNIGWHRVQSARHYPSDIYAGRTLARAIARELKASPAFRHDFAEVKAEIDAAQHSAGMAVRLASPGS